MTSGPNSPNDPLFSPPPAPDATAERLVQLRLEKAAAIVAKDFERAAAARDEEKRLTGYTPPVAEPVPPGLPIALWLPRTPLWRRLWERVRRPQLYH